MTVHSTISSRLLPIVLLLAAAGCGVNEESNPTLGTQPAETGDAALANRFDTGSAVDRVDGVPVTTILRLSNPVAKPGDQIKLTVELQIAPLWEIHALDAQPESTATKLKVIAPTGIALQGPWNEPDTVRSASPAGQFVHVGKAAFQRTLAVEPDATAGTHQIACLVSFQACNEHQCLQPQECTLQATLVIEAQ